MAAASNAWGMKAPVAAAVIVWNYSTGEVVHDFPDQTNVGRVEFLSDRFIVSGNQDGWVQVWDLDEPPGSDGGPRWKEKSAQNWVFALDVSRDGRYVVTTEGNAQVNLWRTE